MREWAIAAAMLAFLGSSASMASVQADTQISADSRFLLQAEDLWMAAARQRNGGELRHFMWGSFRESSFGGSGIPPTSRSVWLDNVLHHQVTQSFILDHPGTQIIGDIGIVTSNYHWIGATDGARFERIGRLVDLWTRRRGGWAVTLRIFVD